jgi:hypothetical protein
MRFLRGGAKDGVPIADAAHTAGMAESFVVI